MSTTQQRLTAPSVKDVTALRCLAISKRNAHPVQQDSTCSCGHDSGLVKALAKSRWAPARSALRIRFERSLRLDPGNVLTTQRAFENELVRRFTKIKQAIRQLVVDEDCFGLKDQPKANTRFAFSTSANKVQSFMSWLEEKNNQGILDITLVGDTRRFAGRKTWENMYIDSAYKKGMVFGDKQLKKKGLRPSSLPPKAVYPVDSFFNAPMHADRVGLIYTRTYNSLKGVTDAMDAAISNTLAQGIAEGKNPNELARDMAEDVDGIGIRRAKLIARTEIMRAHNVAMINTYREAGVVNVEVQAEWSTAGDGRVCPDCESLEGKVFSLSQIETLLPLHPQCRCIALPLITNKEGDVVPKQEEDT